MAAITIRSISDQNDPAISRVKDLFTHMHEQLATQGMLTRLPSNGSDLWIKSIGNGLGRFGELVVAEDAGILIGFAYGAIKLAPEHLGGARMGYVSHLYVVPDRQGSGIGKRLAASLHEWFASKAVDAIELQVVVGNESGANFWRSLGYEVEFLQMRKSLK